MKLKIIPLIIACTALPLSLNALTESQKTYSGKEIRYFGAIIIKNENIQDQKILIYGTARLENSTFKKNVTCSGSLTPTSCTFYDDVQVSGSLKATQSSFNDNIEVSGDALFDNCDCKKDLSIRGSFEAIHSTLNDLSISTTEFTIDDSIVNNIKVIKDGSGLTDQNLYLNNSTVKGDIFFESGNGKIHIKGNTKITGKVKGAVTIKE